MTKEETLNLLTLIGLTYSDFDASEPNVNAWSILFENEGASQVMAAFKHWVKNSGSSFAPKPSEIFAALRSLSADPLDNADVVWARGPRAVENDEKALNAWRLWGGYSRWGMLPDVAYCDDAQAAERTRSFAKKEFVQMFNSLSKKQTQKQAQLTHDEAKRFLLGAKQ